MPGHGSTHLLFIQAWLLGQSGLITHSGRQFGGEPIYPVKQEHEGCLLCEARHCEFGPHGEGWHGSFSASTGSVGGAAVRFQKS